MLSNTIQVKESPLLQLRIQQQEEESEISETISQRSAESMLIIESKSSDESVEEVK